MSNVSSIYDAFKSEMSTTFASKTQIPNPFSIENNNDNTLRDGYGIRFGAAGLASFDLPSFQGYSREIVVTFTTQVFRTDNNILKLEDAQKALMENQNTLINSLAKSRAFDDYAVSVEFTTDSGIEFVFGDKFSFLYIDSSFEVQYKEDKNYCYP